MKKLLCTLATKMQPGFIQNIIGGLGSKTPRLFKQIQMYSAVLITLSGSTLGAIQTGELAVPHPTAISFALTFLVALFTGIGGASALPTTDLKFVSPEIVEKIVRDTPAAEVKEGKQKDDPTPNSTDFPAIR